MINCTAWDKWTTLIELCKYANHSKVDIENNLFVTMSNTLKTIMSLIQGSSTRHDFDQLSGNYSLASTIERQGKFINHFTCKEIEIL